ncbi:MAG TPA: glucose-6-phosphate dehydrogenase assembly protein OpcA [Solirubrobacteraceae bacterium]|jgi:glucose-6-phosphate dehydrogenase assembly protein OpcA|nr:glucose-6-phosphate dehydrogenase assembly protein OpcA [Solirubrobacteraceae bacterium]
MPTVNDTVWREQDTTPAAIEAALRELLIERHAESEFYVPARVLNLVCIVEREWSGEIANRLRAVGRFHASRTIVCSVSPKRTSLDAIATVAASSDPGSGSLALTRETVVIDVGTRHIPYLDTIIDPLVVTDLATMVWAPHGHWDAVDALREMAQIVLLDSVDDPDVAGALRRATGLSEDRNVVDLAWIRSAPWRERIAATFDSPARRPELDKIRGVELRHHSASGAAALLLCGWLTSRLGWEPAPLTLPEPGLATGAVVGPGGKVQITLRSVPLEVPGLSGITLRMDDDSSLSLERGRGGLRATRRTPAGDERSWTLLGASRGEGGILGEGIRQALLRDQIYGPALRATAGLLA